MARKDPAAVKLGRKGGKARIASLTKEELQAANRKAAQARWAKAKKTGIVNRDRRGPHG